MSVPLKKTAVDLSEKTILLCGEYSKVFSFIINLVSINNNYTLLILDDFNLRTMLSETGSLNVNKLSEAIVSRFESLVELDKVLEHSETLLLNNGPFSLLVLGSLSNAYLREISLHESSSHANILYLLNKVLASFSFLSRKYGCTGILIGPSGDSNGSINIPAKRIFLYWVDYILDLHRCGIGRTIGELSAKTGEKIRLCIPSEGFKETGEIGKCEEHACPGNV